MNIKNIFASAGLVTLVTIATMSYQVKAAGTTRISGENRYETAANVASTNWTSSSCKNAIIVSGESYADAVSASVLAKTLNAPILFTESESLDSNTQNALEKLKPENIYIIGGTGVVSQSVQNLLSDYNVTRLSGENRYSTNLAVADKLVELGVKANKVLVVGGQGFSDALSTAPIASAKNEILLLADNNENDMEGTAEFVSKNNSDVMVIGTENMVNSKIYNKLNASNRLDGGKDRFETNLKILDYYKDNLKNNKMYVADIAGNSYADALVATALSGKYSAPLVFTGTEGETGTINAIFYINSNADKYSTSINVVGGTGILPNSIVNSISPSSSKSSDNDHDSSSSHSSSSGSSSSSTSQQAIAVATTAVEKSESSKLQSDVDSAKALVDALEDSTDKTSLLTRLQKVQQEIDEAKEQQVLSDATTAVEKAESSKVQADVDCAKILVNALVDSKDKTDLLNRLQVVQEYINTQNDNNDGSSSDDSSSNSQQALDNATSAVEKAESSKTQSDVDSAKTLVKALVDGTDKTNLLNRLAVVQKAIDDKTAQDAENAAYQKELQDATNAVAKAENSKLQADIDSAKNLVDKLNDSDKSSLNSRLDVVQQEIDDAKEQQKEQQALSDATSAVEKAESSKLQTDVDSAKTLVDALPDSTDKNDLVTRLQVVQKAIDDKDAQDAENAAYQKELQDATNAVVKAENSKLQVDVDSAKNLVDKLNNSDKASLGLRLDVVQRAIDDAEEQQDLSDAISAVEKAESSKLQTDVDSAKTLVNALPDSTDKNDLLTRLQVIQKAIDDKDAQDAENATYQKELQDATNAVVKAENSKLQVDVDSAKTLVNALVDGKDKTDLLTRLQVVQKTIDDKDSEDQVITTHEGFYNALENAFENCDTMLDIYTDSEDMSKYNPVTTINELEINRPDLVAEYLGTNNNTATKISDNKYEFKLNFEFGDTTEVLLQKREVSQNKVSQIIESVITADMTDYDKELALHDYLVNNCEYDPTVIAGDIPDGRDDDYTAYGALINEKAVCQGYADAMYRLLKAVGIKSIMVSGTATNGVNTEAHAWNIVTIGGQTYQLDATFDDPSYKDGRNNPTHDYFNITDSQLSKDHTWDTSEYPACNSTDYSYKN